MFLKAMPMSYSLILLLAVAGDALPFGPSRSRDLGIVDSYMQDLHESAVKEITAHRYDANGSLPSSSSSDRYLQIKNPCGYVKLSEIEETYRTATGVAFECSCQAYGFSDSGETTCESKEPFCCSPNFDEGTIMDCTTATEKAVFSVVPFSGYFVPRPRSSRVCMTFTGDDERKDSEICRTNDFTREDTFDGKFTCQAMFDGSLCRDCTQCSDGSEGGAYDCSNVARSSNFQVTCDGGNGPNRTCRAQYEVTSTEPPTPSPSKTPTLRPTPVPVQKDLPSTSPQEDAPASQPTQPAQSDLDSDREHADDSLQKIVGPQSVLCADGFCNLSDEEAAQQCNFYALSKYGDANFNSDGKAIVENINTAKGPIEIGEGCVMECKGCYLVLSPTSSGFSSRSWSFAGTSTIALLLVIIGLLYM